MLQVLRVHVVNPLKSYANASYYFVDFATPGNIMNQIQSGLQDVNLQVEALTSAAISHCDVTHLNTEVLHYAVNRCIFVMELALQSRDNTE